MPQSSNWHRRVSASAIGVVLCLAVFSPVLKSQVQNDPKPAQQAPEFYDEPKFTVSDVADPTGLGGHGSNANAAARQSLAKDVESIRSTAAGAEQLRSRNDLEKALQHDPSNAELHRLLGEAEEKSGEALAAVKEFQRAAELDASEQNLFSWGSELLEHDAVEPAAEVFSKGHRLFPRSVRMLTALGTAKYLHGSYEQATEKLCDASDLAPNDASPHIFLGKILEAESASTERVRNTLRRYASLRPADANANYLYALSLWKQPASSHDAQISSWVENLLQKSIRLDSNFGPAYLQLGIVYSQKLDFLKAKIALEKAAALEPKSEQAHYRLAQVYRRLGEGESAQREMQAYRDAASQLEERVAREQRSKQVFVFTPQAQGGPQ